MTAEFETEVRAWVSQFTHANLLTSQEAYWKPGPTCVTRGASTLCLSVVYGDDGAAVVSVYPYGGEDIFTAADWAACDAPIILAKSVLRENGVAIATTSPTA